jgi:tetratricopeptide (TPR) repeat protein
MTIRLRRATLALLFAALFFVAAATHARAQGANTLEGRVSMPGGAQPNSPVKITLTFNGTRLYETFTDLSGRFSFGGLKNGRYQLVAESDGATFETTSVYADVTGYGVSAQTFTQNVQLLPKRGKSGDAASAGVVSAEELDPGVPERARESYRKGLKSAAENRPEQAIKSFEEALRSHPSFYVAALKLAEQYAKLERYAEALGAYRKAGELKPELPEAYVGIGVTLVSQKRYEEGIRMLRRIVELDEKLASPYLSLGYAEMMLGDYKAAERDLLRALELARPAIAHVYLANVYEQLGQPAKAVEQLQSYLKENPDSPNAASVRGAIEKLRKKRKE